MSSKHQRPRRGVCARALACTTLLVAAPIAHATDVADSDKPGAPYVAADGELFERGFVNLRLGAAASLAASLPVICAELTPIEVFSIEACGNGSGFLHQLAAGDMAHFRGKWNARTFRVGKGTHLIPSLGAGFAELETGPDEPGFRFFAPQTATVGSVAGPELSTGIAFRQHVGFGVDVLLHLTGGVAWFPYAAQLTSPQSAWQPFASMELGAGW